MSLIIGIVGLPNVGKSSLFNALTKSDAVVDNRPFSTINPNLGVVKLMDDRIDSLAKLVNPKTVTHATVKFLDIAGLVKGASQGAGLGNKFLENIRGVDEICLVVRAFRNDNLISVLEGTNTDPIFEAEIVLCELIYADLDMVNNVMKKLKSNDPKMELLSRLKVHLEENNPVVNFFFADGEREMLKIYSFLTDKPMVLVANTDDSDDSKKLLKHVEEYAKKLGVSYIDVNIKLEGEIDQLPEKDMKELLEAMGRDGTCLNNLVRLTFGKLKLGTFFTVGEKEVRA
ncbi:ribosome-binding ATPase YchF-like [Rattus rattus]|uniref:ribosome-binding ATPase YchF-like n=1 Tax=Rattus rattus TaxID=10117 RepID=UPI0013F382BA|nr:ribosome-binding ATPase YchF-like [Rattus rattus]